VSAPRQSMLQAVQSLVYIIVVALFIITFTVQPFRIPSESMEPTLLVGDFLLVNKQVSRHGGLIHESAIRRGDLIVFHYPLDPSMHLVKRVVGLPGDRLRLHDGRVFLSGQPLAEPYAYFRPAGPDTYRDDFPRVSTADPGVDSRWWIAMHSLVDHGELTVPPDSYFVLGDNRNDSEDSRYWGFVPRANIVGKPFLIYFSLKDAGPAANTVASRRDDSSLVDFARWDRALRVIY
jgi:signal peptidase I